MADEPPLPNYPHNTAAFGRIMERLISKGSDFNTALRLANEGLAPEIDDLQAITDAELYLVSRVAHATRTVKDPAVQNSLDLEIGRRGGEAVIASTAALVAFREESATASGRLLTLTKWLIVFTIVVVVLTVVLAVHDLTR